MVERKMRTKNKPKMKSSQGVSHSDEDVHYHYHMNESDSGYQKTNRQPLSGSQPHPRDRDGRRRDVHYHYYYEPPRHKVKRSSKPTIAGSLLIINGTIQIIAVIILLIAGSMIGSFGEGISFFDEDTKGDITGTVTIVNETPVENVTISILGEPISTTTDSNGIYSLENVPSGNHKIKVEKEGYNTIIYKAFISPSNGDIQIDFDEDDHNSDNDFDFVLTPGDDELERGSYPPFEWIGSILYICAFVITIIAIFQFIGGYYAIKRKNFGLTIICAIIGIFAILSIIALFILILSKDEFKKPEEQAIG